LPHVKVDSGLSTAQDTSADEATHTPKATSSAARQFAKSTQIVETMVDTQPAMAICETDAVLDQDRGFFVHVSMQKVPPRGCEHLLVTNPYCVIYLLVPILT
jgi:hypothetical protein